MIIEDQQSPKASGHSLAAAKEKLDRPNVAGNDRKRGEGDQAWILCEMLGRPNSKGSFGSIAEAGQEKTGPAEQPSHIFCANISAA